MVLRTGFGTSKSQIKSETAQEKSVSFVVVYPHSVQFTVPCRVTALKICNGGVARLFAMSAENSRWRSVREQYRKRAIKIATGNNLPKSAETFVEILYCLLKKNQTFSQQRLKTDESSDRTAKKAGIKTNW